jgi:exodeoxyribonuclease-3
MLRIISLNLNGIRSAWSKNVLPWAVAQTADVVCLQELKAQPDLTAEMRRRTACGRSITVPRKGLQRGWYLERSNPIGSSRAFDGGEFDAEGAIFGPISAICR